LIIQSSCWCYSIYVFPAFIFFAFHLRDCTQLSGDRVLLIHVTDRFCSYNAEFLLLCFYCQSRSLFNSTYYYQELHLEWNCCFFGYSLHIYISRELSCYFSFLHYYNPEVTLFFCLFPGIRIDNYFSISISAFHVHMCPPWLLTSLQDSSIMHGVVPSVFMLQGDVIDHYSLPLF